MAVGVFISCDQHDRELCDELVKHLTSLKKQQIMHEWYVGYIIPGVPREAEILEHLANAQIILLLISKDFLASEFCYSVEMQEAIARHKVGQVRVVPVLLRSVDVQGEPFTALSMLPSDGVPVIKWPDRDDAFVDIVQGIRKVIGELTPNPPQTYRRRQASAR